MKQCHNPNCLHQNLANTKFCVKCGIELHLSDRLSQEHGDLIKANANNRPSQEHGDLIKANANNRPSQRQDNDVQNITAGGDFTFAPHQTIIETQIIQSSVEAIAQRELNKNSPYQGLKRFNFKDR